MGELLAHAARRGFATHRIGVFDFGISQERAPLRLLVKSLLVKGTGGVPLADCGDAASRIAALQLPLADHPLLADLLGLELNPEQKVQIDAMANAVRDTMRGEALASLASCVAGKMPQFVLVEDLHWADVRTLDALAALARICKNARLVLAVTTRIESDPLERIRLGATGIRLMSIELVPLAPRDARSLALTIIGHDSPALKNCIDRSGGNPLFLEQLIRHTSSVGLAKVPGSVQSIVLSSLDALSAADRAAAQAASVLGQQFISGALRHLIVDDAYDLLPLVTARLVRPEGTSWQFTHALIRDGVYASQLEAGRRDLHKKAADWFESRDLVLHAEHLELAADERAPRAFLLAAERIGEGYELDRAFMLAERGAALAKRPEDLCELQLARANLLLEMGKAEEAVEACRAAGLAAPNDVTRARARLGEASALRVIDRVDEALRLLDEAETPLAAGNCLADLSRLEHLRGNLLFPKGEIDACRMAHERALGHAQTIGSRRHEVRALGGLGDAYYALGRFRTSHEYFTRCVDLARELGLGRVELANLPMVGFALCTMGEFEKARAVAEQARKAASAAHQARAEIIACHLAMFTDFMCGRPQKTEAVFERAQELSMQIGARRFEPENLAFAAEALRQMGHRKEAIERLERALAIARETGMDYCGPVVLGYLALAANERSELREQALKEGLELIADGGLFHNVFFFCCAAIECCIELNEWERIELFADRIERAFHAEPLRLITFIVDRARTLARVGKSGPSTNDLNEIHILIADCQDMGCVSFLTALEMAEGRMRQG